MSLKHVKYTGCDKNLKGKTALMNKEGLVQLDGNDDWRLSDEYRDKRCYGWHNLGSDWDLNK